MKRFEGWRDEDVAGACVCGWALCEYVKPHFPAVEAMILILATAVAVVHLRRGIRSVERWRDGA